MLHEIEDLEAEKSRVLERTEFDSAPPVLAFVEIEVDGDPADYSGRLRAALGAALDLAVSESFDDDLPTGTVPAWFAGVCKDGEGPVEAFAARGRERYTERTGDGPWELQDWLSRFDPDLEVRGWAWWDLTGSPEGEGRLRLWLDTWGEAFFSWEDLRWLLYVCGARSVADPMLVKPEVWAREASV
ncbi:hypothetical protein ACIQ7Q_22785 [Streptomyces sp. NPDC096176]|uniref:hypothetical protein n=1 Tax=Streptomyces sp. NPDC096176 TaxID=3366079 RepID=UPI0038183160